jgi:transcriptional regulator with XRE-family HTH domain
MLLRNALGETLRHARIGQSRTLRDVSTVANVSLGYLSEVERGRKEASSELLAAICEALDLEVSDVLDNASSAMRVASDARATADAARTPVRAASDQSLRIVMPYRPARAATSAA